MELPTEYSSDPRQAESAWQILRVMTTKSDLYTNIYKITIELRKFFKDHDSMLHFFSSIYLIMPILMNPA